MAENPLSWVVSAMRAGLSASAGLAAAREGGFGIRRQTWLRTWAEVKNSTATGLNEMARPLNRRPIGGEISVMPTKGASGFLQHVDVFLRDRETGEVRAQPFSVATDFLDTRADVIDTALSKFQEATHPDGSFPDDVVIGAAYVGTHILTPFGEE